MIGRSHSELGHFTAHDPVRRGCDQSQRTKFCQNEVSWDEWYDEHSAVQSSDVIVHVYTAFTTHNRNWNTSR